MAVKERSQIKGTDAQIKAFAGHNGVLAFATDTKSLHVLSGTAGTTTEFLPSSKVATKTELANYTPTASLATVATSGSYNDLSDKPVVDSALSATSENPVQNKVVKSALDGKLSLSGGTMTGTLKIQSGAGTLRLQTYGATGSSTTASGAHVATVEDDSYLEVHPSNPGKGAQLFMASSDYSGDALSPGQFILRSMSTDKTSIYDLKGTNIGSLTWCGNEVARVVSSGKSADGNQWYRKYNDGYIEQGGYYDNGSYDHFLTLDITFLTPFSGVNYSITANSGATEPALLDGTLGIFGQSATSVGIKFWGASTDIRVRYIYWHACGY